MDDLYKLIDFLRDKEFTEEELVLVYRSYFRREHNRGFNEGCDFIRNTLRRQKMMRRENVKKRFNALQEIIGDYLADDS